MLRQRHHIALFLMSLGLALLGVFLWVFLKKTWDDELAGLRRETNLLFVNAVRSIETQVFDELIVSRWKSATGDSAMDISLRLPALPRSADSAKMIAFVREEHTVLHKSRPADVEGDSSRMKIVLRSERLPGEQGMAGALSVLMRVDLDTTQAICLDSTQPALLILPLLEKKFAEGIQQSALPVQWRMTRLNAAADSSAHTAESFLAGQYTDLASGEHLGAEISAYRGHLFRKIGPQILFSGLLFSCVGLAFLFVYQSLRQQMRLTEIKNDFIRNMTHELKTPISTVSAAIEALQHFDALDNPARTREYLAISQLELNRLSLLVDKVLRMSRFEQHEPELKIEPLDLRQLVEEVLAAMKLQFEKYRAEVSFSTSGESFALRGDRLHLLSVLYNLLDNALKYSIDRPRIAVSLAGSGGQLALKVRDWGRGIPPEYQARVFEKFFRVPTGDVHDVKGHGLGLNYVAGVLRQHQGGISVESREGEGAEFTVTLPADGRLEI